MPATFTRDDEHIHVLIETPKGTGNKYTYYPEQDYFKLTKILPTGLVFPVDFGFIPGTLADDGDPLDAVVMMDSPAFTGCIVECRIAGVMKAMQLRDGKKERNDRIIAVPSVYPYYSHIKSIDDINQQMLEELGSFFTYYCNLRGKQFEVTGFAGPATAKKIIQAQISNG